jgi:outer membrane protein OmpA-like peptidoglycan-associated protein
VTGTFDTAAAKSLTVSLAGASYTLGAPDSPLTAEGGVWTLAAPRALKDGVYDVVAAATDASGAATADATKDELTVDAAGPAAPTVNLYSGDKSPATISGSWAEGDAVSLDVTLNGKTAKLGPDTALTSSGGLWTLEVAEKLPPASYDVTVATADARGRAASDQTRFEILVKEAPIAEPPPPPPPPPPEVDCEGEMAKVLIQRPIVFDTDKWSIRRADLETIASLAALANACPDKTLEVGGHTDWIAPAAYNRALSERRARAVARSLAAAGVAEGRLSAKGYGEDVPLASNDTPEGRAVNRRIEIKIAK